VMGGDINSSLPSAEIAVMGPRGAIEILYSRQIKEAKDEEKEALRVKLAKEYSDKFASPYQTASMGSIDEVIEPAQARTRLIGAFRVLSGKRRPGEHERTGNIPL